ISGEDAPDLVATAPVPVAQIVRAKVEAVLGVITAIFIPFILAIALLSARQAIICALGIGVASASSTMIPLWFRAQAKRSPFRRRQPSSRMATFAEAFSSVSWAATAALAAAGTWFFAISGMFAIFVLLGARTMSPPRV